MRIYNTFHLIYNIFSQVNVLNLPLRVEIGSWSNLITTLSMYLCGDVN